MYAYIEVEVTGTADEIIEANKHFTCLSKGGAGLVDSQFREALDRYLWGDECLDAETYLAMNESQQEIIQAIKRSRKRNAYPDREMQEPKT